MRATDGLALLTSSSLRPFSAASGVQVLETETAEFAEQGRRERGDHLLPSLSAGVVVRFGDEAEVEPHSEAAFETSSVDFLMSVLSGVPRLRNHSA